MAEGVPRTRFESNDPVLPAYVVWLDEITAKGDPAMSMEVAETVESGYIRR
jgi:hypothetical protein